MSVGLLRRPGLFVLSVALTLRLLGVGAITIYFDGTLFSDDRSYLDTIDALTTGKFGCTHDGW